MALDALLHRKRPSLWQEFQQAPCVTIAKQLYSKRQLLLAQQATNTQTTNTRNIGITVICISDTHNSTPPLPSGDLLVHAGDLTQTGTFAELQAQLDWLNAQPHTYKVIIAGNHDILLDAQKCTDHSIDPRRRDALKWGSIIYLDHSSTTLTFPGGNKISLFGHPGTRKHGNWAFQFDKGTDVFTNRIPDDIDILITHSPPKFHCDVAGWGDEFLLREVWRVKPALHVFGHVHEGYGRDVLVYDRFERLYERGREGSGGVFGLMQMVLLLIWMVLVRPDGKAKRTVLVNASVVGGLVDADRREVQFVQL